MSSEKQEIIEHPQTKTETIIQQPVNHTPWGMIAFIFVAILIALAAGGFSFYLFQQLQQNKAQLDQVRINIDGQLSGKLDSVSGRFTHYDERIKTMSDNTTDKIKSLADSINQRFNTVSSRISGFHQQVAAVSDDVKLSISQNKAVKQRLQQLEDALMATRRELAISNEQLTEAIDKLYKEKGKTRNEWILSEVEYLLLIANHGVNLSNDVHTAIIALQAADERLLELGDPGIINIRKAIADELIQLKAVPVFDLAGQQLKLTSMIKHINQLKVLNSEIPEVESLLTAEKADEAVKENAVQPEDAMQAFKQKLLLATDKFVQELKNLVAIRKKQSRTEALISPEQKFFVLQLLSLKLESARKAMLDGRNDLFHALIAEATALLEQHFDLKHQATANFASQLQSFRTIRLSPELPNISFSLQELRKYVKKLEAHRKAQAEAEIAAAMNTKSLVSKKPETTKTVSVKAEAQAKQE